MFDMAAAWDSHWTRTSKTVLHPDSSSQIGWGALKVTDQGLRGEESGKCQNCRHKTK